MKKLIATLLVLALAAPAMAASVDLTDNTDGTGTLTLTVGVGEVVRGLGVLVSADTPILSVTGTDAIFNVSLDAAYDAETAASGSYVIGTGSPVANPAAAGVLDISAGTTSAISLSMGVLDQAGGQAGAPAGTYTVGIIDLGGAGNATLLADDTLRGGVVGDGLAATTYSVEPITLVSTPCMGNGNGDDFVDGGDVSGFLAAYGSQVGDANFNPIYNFNGDGFIDGADVGGFIAVYGTTCP